MRYVMERCNGGSWRVMDTKKECGVIWTPFEVEARDFAAVLNRGDQCECRAKDELILSLSMRQMNHDYALQRARELQEQAERRFAALLWEQRSSPLVAAITSYDANGSPV